MRRQHRYPPLQERNEAAPTCVADAGEIKTKLATPRQDLPLDPVILSGAGTSRSEVPAESKDPYTLHRAKHASGNSPRALDSRDTVHNSLTDG